MLVRKIKRSIYRKTGRSSRASKHPARNDNYNTDTDNTPNIRKNVTDLSGWGSFSYQHSMLSTFIALNITTTRESGTVLPLELQHFDKPSNR
jgi:hypothetical protein